MIILIIATFHHIHAENNVLAKYLLQKNCFLKSYIRCLRVLCLQSLNVWLGGVSVHGESNNSLHPTFQGPTCLPLMKDHLLSWLYKTIFFGPMGWSLHRFHCIYFMHNKHVNKKHTKNINKNNRLTIGQFGKLLQLLIMNTQHHRGPWTADQA